jgi:hypothetical protein
LFSAITAIVVNNAEVGRSTFLHLISQSVIVRSAIDPAAVLLWPPGRRWIGVNPLRIEAECIILIPIETNIAMESRDRKPGIESPNT